MQFCSPWICFLTQNCTRNHVITYTKKVLSFWCFHGRNIRLYIHLARSNVVSLVHLKVRGLQDFLMWTTVTLLSFDSVVHWIDIRESLFTFSLRSSLNWYTRVLIHFLFKFSFIYLFFPSFIHFFQSFDCSLVGSFVPLFSLFLCSFIRIHTSISTYWISYVLQIRYKIVSNVISITAWTVFSDECSQFFLLKLRWPMDPQTINAMYSFNENEISE